MSQINEKIVEFARLAVSFGHVGCGEHSEPHHSGAMRFVPHRILRSAHVRTNECSRRNAGK